MNNAKLGLLLALVISTPAQAAEITFLVGGALKPVMEELAPALSAQANGHEIKMSIGLASKMTDEIKNGRAFDLVFFPVAEVDALVVSGKVAASSKATPVRSNIAVIVTEGAPKPNVSSVEGFKRTMVEAKSVAITAQGPSGLTWPESLIDWEFQKSSSPSWCWTRPETRSRVSYPEETRRSGRSNSLK